MATMILRDTHLALEKRMKELDKQKKETAIKIREAASHGDLKENGEYHAAREEQSFIVRKTQTLQTHSPFQIIEYAEIETDTVGFGNKVIISEENKKEISLIGSSLGGFYAAYLAEKYKLKSVLINPVVSSHLKNMKDLISVIKSLIKFIGNK